MEETSLVVVPLPPTPSLEVLGQQANQAGKGTLFQEYHRRLAEKTRARKLDDLTTFAWYILEAEAQAGGAVPSWNRAPAEARARALAFFERPEAWKGLTWGLVSAFVQWQIRKGFAIGTINLHLSTVKRYAELAFQAEMIATEEYGAIRGVHMLTYRAGLEIDKERVQAPSGVPTRIGTKKAEPYHLTRAQADALKHDQPDDPDGRRNALLMCLLLDHGLRVSEVQLLDVAHFDGAAGEVRVYRPKVTLTQTLRLSSDTWAASARYFRDHPDGVLFPGRWKKDDPNPRITLRSLQYWVRDLGQALKKAKQIPNLSPHDCRHYWATMAGKYTKDTKRLQQAGGWRSGAMPLRYQADAAIANEGLILGPEEVRVPRPPNGQSSVPGPDTPETDQQGKDAIR